MHVPRRILLAENLIGTERSLEEIDYLRRALRVQVWRDIAHPFGQWLSVRAMSGDVPVIAERVLYARLAGAIVLVNRLVQRRCAGPQRARVDGIRVSHEQPNGGGTR